VIYSRLRRMAAIAAYSTICLMPCVMPGSHREDATHSMEFWDRSYGVTGRIRLSADGTIAQFSSNLQEGPAVGAPLLAALRSGQLHRNGETFT
jgi:hypothetical protein